MVGERKNQPQEGRPPPTASEPAVPDYVSSAWRTWLATLATDPDAATAAAMTYASLAVESRNAWLDAVAMDAHGLGVPAIALYAPLLAVEPDAALRERIEMALAVDPVRRRPARSRAWRGVGSDGVHACVIASPLYLDFVQVLSCRYTPGGGFVAVRHDPIANAATLPPRGGDAGPTDGVAIEPTPLRVVIEELAHAILAHKRRHKENPYALKLFAHLFAPDLDGGEEAEAISSSRF